MRSIDLFSCPSQMYIDRNSKILQTGTNTTFASCANTHLDFLQQ